jgi:hypothetical protein
MARVVLLHADLAWTRGRVHPIRRRRVRSRYTYSRRGEPWMETK